MLVIRVHLSAHGLFVKSVANTCDPECRHTVFDLDSFDIAFAVRPLSSSSCISWGSDVTLLQYFRSVPFSPLLSTVPFSPRSFHSLSRAAPSFHFLPLFSCPLHFHMFFVLIVFFFCLAHCTLAETDICLCDRAVRVVLSSFRYVVSHQSFSPHVWEYFSVCFQCKMLRLIIQTRRKYIKIEKQDIEPKEENGNVDITEMCGTDDEGEDGQSTKTQDAVK